MPIETDPRPASPPSNPSEPGAEAFVAEMEAILDDPAWNGHIHLGVRKALTAFYKHLGHLIPPT